MAAALWRSLARRKPLPSTSHHADPPPTSSLARVLTAWDLTALGVGSTLGVGIYVLAGDVARRQAGPAVLLSFVVAGVASGLAGLCYAEFGARVPLAGSAYVYSYVSVGELLAFVIGWSLVLEYAIGSASVARAMTSYVDQLTGNILQRTFEKLLPMNVPILASYADPVSFAVALGLSVILAFGVRESLSLNNIFSGLNMAVILFVVIAGAFKADIKNWNLSPSDAPNNAYVGDGGFMPFGISGVLRGAATCFYGFIGFDCIAATGEEVRRPQKAIPIAILGSLLIVCLSYLAVSAALTLMWPFYGLKDDGAPLAYVFHQVGWPIAQWAVAIGGIFGLLTSLFGTMFPLPRVIYAMAADGLIFRFLGEIHPRFKTPFIGTLLSGLLTGIMGALFHLQQLVDMLSIGTLMAYTLVATCVLLLRYRASEDDEANALLNEQIHVRTTPWVVIKQLFNSHGLKSPTNLSSYTVTVLIILYCLFSVLFAVLLVYNERGIIPLGTVASVMTLLLIFISLQPSTIKSIPFKVPLVPILPALSISMNIYLMLLLDRPTWIRFAVWMVVGCLLWVVYIACRCCIPEVKFKESYENAGFDQEEIRPNGAAICDVTDGGDDFKQVNDRNKIPLEQIEAQTGQGLPDNHVDSPEITTSNRVNRFVRPTSVIQGELPLESVTELPPKGDSQVDNDVRKQNRFHRPNSVQEGRISFEFASESDVLSIDSDAHSLYPEVFICLPIEEETKQQKAIEEEKDSGEEHQESLESARNSLSNEISGVVGIVIEDDLEVRDVCEDETRCHSKTDSLRESSSEQKSLSRNGSFLESDDGYQSVLLPTKPDPDTVMGSTWSDAVLSHTGETVALAESQECTSETDEDTLLSSDSDIGETVTVFPISNLDTREADLQNPGVICADEPKFQCVQDSVIDKVCLDNECVTKNEDVFLSTVTPDEISLNDENIPNNEDVLLNSTPKTPNNEEKISNTLINVSENRLSENSKINANSPKKIRNSEKQNRSPLPNFSISSFDDKPIDIESNRKKFKSTGLKSAMAAGSFSDSSFVERLNNVVGQRSGSSSPPASQRAASAGTPMKEANDDMDDDVFISSEAVPSRENIRERLETVLSNGPSRASTTRFDPTQRPQTIQVAKEQLETRKVIDQNQLKTGERGDPTAESRFTEKLGGIIKRHSGSLPPIKKKDRQELLLGGHTLPERRHLKVEPNDGHEDVPSKSEIRRRLELLFSKDPNRVVTPYEEVSTVL